MRIQCLLYATLIVGCQDTRVSEHPWIGYKEGSFAKFSVTFTKNGQVVGKVEHKYTVKRATSESVIVTFDTGKATNETEYSSPKSDDSIFKPSENDEPVIEVDGKKFTCKVRVGKIGDVEVKQWVCDEVAAKIVKEETRSQQLQATKLVVKLNEIIKVSGKEVTCWVQEEKVAQGGGPTVVRKVWRSKDVPGWDVKIEEVGGHIGIDMVKELVEFDVKK